MLIPAEDEPGGHGRDHAGDMHRFARQISDPAQRDVRQHDQHPVAQTARDENPGRTDREPDQHAPDRNHGEILYGIADMEDAAQRRDHREAEEDQSGRIVEQAFAFEQGRQAAWQGHALEHGARRNRVGRRNDRAERETGRPRQRRENPVGDHPDDQRGKDHRPDGER
jgi:hypothetical protein